MLALAAGLWLVYLVPSWLRRREYLATERNAVRLQQTLRILAESSEVPEEVRAETSARSVATLQRSLMQQEQLAAAVEKARGRAAARKTPDAQPALAAVVSSRTIASRRLRRTRIVTALVLPASVTTLVIQLLLLATTGLGGGTPAVLAFSGVGSITSFALLGRLAAISRARSAAFLQQQPPAVKLRKRSSPAPASVPAPVASASADVAAPASAPWTPVPVPKPLYLSRPAPEPVVVVADEVAAELREATAIAAAKAAAIAERERLAPAVEPIPIKRPSRFAAMGVIDDTTSAVPDLDAVLRRRRSAG